MQLLKDILNMAAAVPLEPDVPVSYWKEVGEGEEVIGVLSDGLKRLFLVYCRIYGDLESLEKRTAKRCSKTGGEKDISDEGAISLAEEVARMRDKFRLAEASYFLSVRYEFPHVPDDKLIGIRAGWKVVIHDPAETQTGSLGGFVAN